jgi:hypothetical protein
MSSKIVHLEKMLQESKTIEGRQTHPAGFLNTDIHPPTTKENHLDFAWSKTYFRELQKLKKHEKEKQY